MAIDYLFSAYGSGRSMMIYGHAGLRNPLATRQKQDFPTITLLYAINE